MKNMEPTMQINSFPLFQLIDMDIRIMLLIDQIYVTSFVITIIFQIVHEDESSFFAF